MARKNGRSTNGTGLRRGFIGYKSYMFKNKDPDIDLLRGLVMDRHGKLTRKVLKHIEIGGGPKVGTTANWFFGDTQRPQSASLEAAGRAIGYRRQWVPLKNRGA
jgi:hypothetical protein